MNSNTNWPFPRVFVIALNWNGKDDTIECVASLKRLNYPNYEIVVVDNASTDGSVSALRAQYPDITIIENGQNLGYAEGFNTGLRYAYDNGADYFFILNNDTVIDSEALIELVRVAQEDEKIGFVSGKVYWHTKPDTFQTVGRYNHSMILAGLHVGSGEVDHGQYDEAQDYDFIDDIFLLVRREVYETVGGYDPNFFLYYEETDWCARVRRAGFRIVYAPAAKIWHKGFIGNENITFSPKRIFYLQRNQIPFMWRNASREQFAIYLRHLLSKLPRRTAGSVKRGQFAEMFAYLKGTGSGMVWLWRNRHVTGPRSQAKTGRSVS